MERCIARSTRISPPSPLYRIAATPRLQVRAYYDDSLAENRRRWQELHSDAKPKPNRFRNREPSFIAARRQTDRRIKALERGVVPRTDHASSMTTKVALATLPSADTPGTCILLKHDRGVYLFGHVAEGTQRAIGARKMAFATLSNVFLSGSVGWDGLGGLPGLLLTTGSMVHGQREAHNNANAERKARGRPPLTPPVHDGINIHGGENISHALATQRGIIQRQAIKAKVCEHREDPRVEDPTNIEPDWKDDYVKVWKIPVTRERSSEPRKRVRKDESGEGDEEFKEAVTLSNPEIAKFVVEDFLWNGDLQPALLRHRQLANVRPEDKAIVFENGTPKLYKGPYASDQGTAPPEGEAWVLAPNDITETGRYLPVENAFRLPLPRTTYSQTSMSYIVKSVDRRGKFNVKAAKALDLDVSQYGALTAGQEVINKKGETVKPEQVMGEPIRGNGFVVADISGPDFVESFVARPEWSNKELMANVVAIYWLLAPGLATHPKIKKMMADHPSVRHIMCSEDTCPNVITHQSPAELQMKLRRIDPDRYPITKYQNTVDLEAPSSTKDVYFAKPASQIHLMPRLMMDDESAASCPNLQQAWEDVPQSVLKLAEEAAEKANDPALHERIEEEEKDIPNRDAEITCLGTGSSAPAKHRNVSGTLIRVPGVGNYLLDCGEGTLGQLHRLYGKDETAVILRDLKCIVISHLHADHHLGATSIFRAWYEQTIKDKSSAKLAVSCIERYRDIISEFSQIEDFGFHRLVFPMCSGKFEFPSYTIKRAEDFDGEQFGLRAIKHIYVQHCWRSLAQEIELTSGLRIAYSGDCRPSRVFAERCKGAHLLVHECTFNDDMVSDAKKKNHSSLSEALGVARDMEARRTLLTHFSQRYVKADVLSSGDVGGVLMGTDFMTVKLGAFQKAQCFVPAVQRLMEGEDEGDGEDVPTS